MFDRGLFTREPFSEMISSVIRSKKNNLYPSERGNYAFFHKLFAYNLHTTPRARGAEIYQ